MADRRPRDRHKTGALCIRLPRDLDDRLRAEADARGVSITWLVTTLLRQTVERLIPADEWKLTRDG
jgi:predicted HicB family RNase H-like nuclease